MRVLLLGATGGIGRRVLPRLLAAGHQVTTLSRRAGAISAGPSTRPIVGDVTEAAVATEAVDGQDAVICAIGPASMRPDDTVSTGTRKVIAAMRATGRRRLIAVSGNGLGVNGGPVVDWILTPTLLRHVKADAEAQEALITASDLDWTIVRPFRLVDHRPPSLSYRVAATFSPTLLGRWTTRADVARCLLDLLGVDQHHQRIVWVASGGR